MSHDLLVAMHHFNVITRRTVFRNCDHRNVCSTTMMGKGKRGYECGSSKVILKASSATVDFGPEPQPYHLVQLSGR